jgi:hypothetical protein
MNASKLPWFGWLAIAAAFAIAAKLLDAAADYINHIPGKWGRDDFLDWVGIVVLIAAGFSLITAVIRFLKWAWKE